ncbi:hypothetical protein ANCCEY_11747 [Ancylostoma ceylanicum]|uniref:Uncharacterized protein n=1 Tax=Ancylostoma ceylanicum TaxID=53326 RepID=A0A0D6LND7_9BILA|nr:hypothetical protein ANCCEY_11747 [Ancylostoma ceylanicum]
MKALIFILACCGMATSAKCPKTSELTKSDYDNSQDVTTAKVLSKKESGNPLEYKLNHETYIKLYSYDYFYVPETIKIPKNCNTTLKVGEKYVMGYTYSYSNFYDFNFARLMSSLTQKERQILRI